MAKGKGKRPTREPISLADIRDRIVGLERMYPRDILDHPGQWKAHTQEQIDAMVGILKDIGQADALKVWRSERAGGKYVTFDGHLRKSLDPDRLWPVLVTDLTDEEADYALLTHDTITAMAQSDRAAVATLMTSVRSAEAGVQAMLSAMADDLGLYREEEDEASAALLRRLNVTIGDPHHQVTYGDVWRVGPHLLLCLDVFTAWPTWTQYLEGPALFVPYPGPFVALTVKAEMQRLVMVQPDPYVAGHILDMYASARGEGQVGKA